MKIYADCYVEAKDLEWSFDYTSDIIPLVGDVLYFSRNLPDGGMDYWEFRVTERTLYYDVARDLEESNDVAASFDFAHIDLEPWGDTAKLVDKSEKSVPVS